jgi:hypothetical protein
MLNPLPQRRVMDEGVAKQVSRGVKHEGDFAAPYVVRAGVELDLSDARKLLVADKDASTLAANRACFF